MKKIKKNVRDLSYFSGFKLNNLKAIVGGDIIVPPIVPPNRPPGPKRPDQDN